MANLFKSGYTNAQATFVHTYLGDDSTGDGTRERPYRSFTKALTKSPTRLVFRGLINESGTIPNATEVFGDDRNQTLMGMAATSIRDLIYLGSATLGYLHSVQRSTLYNVYKYNPYPGTVVSCHILDGSQSDTASNFSSSACFNSTVNIARVDPQITNQYPIYAFRNCIIYGAINLQTSIATDRGGAFIYSILRSNIIIRYGGTVGIVPNFTVDAQYNVGLLRDAILCMGQNPSTLLSVDAFGNETCKVIWEECNGGNDKNIFNKYEINRTGKLYAAITTGAKTSIRLKETDTPAESWPTSGVIHMPIETTYTNNGVTMPIGSYETWVYTSVTVNGANDITLTGPSYTFKTAHNSLTKICIRYGGVLDYTLNPDPLNDALWSSATGGYVGCFRPNSGANPDNLGTVRNINATGADIGAGDLMQIDTNKKVVFNSSSVQLWNRIQYSQVVNIPLGSSFLGIQGDSSDGSPFGYYIGKHQNLINTTKVYPGTPLIPGVSYKVFNDGGTGILKAVTYNGNNYLPEYTFTCLYNDTDFTLVDAGSGSYVKRINASVLESIEIIPYDDPTTLSIIHPRFSAPVVGQVYCLYYTAAGATRYGKTASSPVLFSHLTEANFLADFPALTNFTWLTVATAAGSFNNITVNDTTGYPSSGVVYINTLRFVYTSKDGTHFYGANQTLTVQGIGTIVHLPNAIGRPETGNRSRIAYYDGWMISSADEEFRSLVHGGLASPLTTYFTSSTPDLRYCKYEINGHFDEPYDY